jgi:hypothetical protein
VLLIEFCSEIERDPHFHRDPAFHPLRAVGVLEESGRVGGKSAHGKLVKDENLPNGLESPSV